MTGVAQRTESRSIEIRSVGHWSRLVSGMALVFALFHWSALVLGSDRGQAGIVVGAIVATAILAVERFWFAASLPAAARAVGFGAPARTALLASTAISVLLVAAVPL